HATPPTGLLGRSRSRRLALGLGIDLLEDRQVLLALEGLGADVGLVLVQGGQLADRLALGLLGEVLVVEFAVQTGETLALRLESTPGLVRFHKRMSLPGGQQSPTLATGT